MNQTVTGSSSWTLHLDEHGEPTYGICRCGVWHGKEDAYSYGHHECFHEEPLLLLDHSKPYAQLLCGLCGNVFGFEEVKGELVS